MKKIVRSILIFFLLIGVILTVAIVLLLRNSDSVLDETVEAIDFTVLNDGVYQGHYDGYRWSNTVSITIHNGEVVDIALVEDVRFTDDITSAIVFTRVIETQTLDIDVVSGATISSIAYLKAIEDAISKAK